MIQLNNAFTLFLSLLVEAMPFLLLGVLLSSILLFFIDERKLISKLPSHPILGAMAGSCIGFLFPVCECGNVPVARRLIIKGVPISVAIGFLLAAPTINPIVIWSTWVAFRDQPEIVFLRVLFSFTIATIIGCIFSIQKDARPLLQNSLVKRINLLDDRSFPETRSKQSEKIPVLLQSGTFLLSQTGQPVRMDSSLSIALPNLEPQSRFFSNKTSAFLNNIILELRELGGMLVVGSAIAACIQEFVPREFVLNLGQDTFSSIIAMIFLAVIVSICSTVDSFFALSFASTFTTSSLLAFLVFGPMIDLKSAGLMLSIFKPKIIFYIFALAAQLIFIFTLAYNYFF
ncbi:MAG: permease [Xenococcaceae cyanobacterium]